MIHSQESGVRVSQFNSSTTPLGAGASFVGQADNVIAFAEIDVCVAGMPSTAPGDLYFEFSPDGVHWDISVWVSGATLPGPSVVPQFLRIILPHFRVRYINGATPQTEFRLTTLFHRQASLRLTRYLDQPVDPTDGVSLTHSIIAALRPDGTYKTINAQDTTPAGTEAGLVTRNIPGGVQPVSAAALPLPAGASTEATLALIKAKTDNIDVALSTRAVTGLTDTQLRASAVPVSAASLPLPSGAATEATLAAIKTDVDKIPASPSQEHVTAASPHAARLSDGAAFYKATTPADTQLVSAAALPLPAGASTEATLALIKAKTDNLDVALSTRAVTGLTDTQLRASAVPVSVASLPLPSGAATEATLALIKAKTDNLDVALSTRTKPADTQTVSGTVTANVGTTNGLALDATLTGGTQKAIVRGGAKGATVAADVTGTAEGADHQALDIQIYHGGSAKDPTQIRALTSADVITAAQGTAAAASGAWTSKVTDGTNIAAVKAASTAAVAGDPALVVAISPNNAITANTVAERSTTGAPEGITVSTSAVLVKASNVSRKSIIIVNNGTTNVYLGKDSAVTTSGAAMGILLSAGGTYNDSGDGLYTGDVYGINSSVSATQNVSVWERT